MANLLQKLSIAECAQRVQKKIAIPRDCFFSWPHPTEAEEAQNAPHFWWPMEYIAPKCIQGCQMNSYLTGIADD
jgi:hypothetical protein